MIYGLESRPYSLRDLDKKIWTVPADRMKAGREHRVPLSARAVAILRQLEKLRSSRLAISFLPGRRATSRFPIWPWKWCCGA
jgi:integrase